MYFIQLPLFQQILISQKIQQSNSQHSKFIFLTMNVITGDDYFSEMVIDIQQRSVLLYLLFRCWHMETRLNVNTVWWAIHNKIDFQLSSDKLTVLILTTKFNQSYINIISTTAKLIIDNVFHNVCFLLLSIVENGCTNTYIGKVILCFSTNILSALYIITQCLLNEESVLQIINILLNRISFYSYPLY